MAVDFTQIGSGPEGVLVCHGWFGDHTAFAPTIPHLDTNRFSYAFLDYRGYGRNRALAGDYSMGEIAADAISVADRLGWRRFHLVGHSMGGMAVQRVMVDVPDRVKSVAALTPVPAAGVPFDADGWALFHGAITDDAKRRAIIDYTTGGRLTPVWLDAMVAASRATTTQEAFGEYLTSWAKTDFLAEAKGNRTPILAVAGEHDPALNADLMRQTLLSWYPNAALEICVNAGHYPMQETPVWLATSMERFMARYV